MIIPDHICKRNCLQAVFQCRFKFRIGVLQNRPDVTSNWTQFRSFGMYVKYIFTELRFHGIADSVYCNFFRRHYLKSFHRYRFHIKDSSLFLKHYMILRIATGFVPVDKAIFSLVILSVSPNSLTSIRQWIASDALIDNCIL